MTATEVEGNVEIQDFLTIYDRPMHKLKLQKVRLVRTDANDHGATYYHFIGMFELVPPNEILDASPVSDEDVGRILKKTRLLEKENPSIIYRKKFTRKVYDKKKFKKWAFNYFFEFNPASVVDFDVNKVEKNMRLYVTGYGKFSS